MNKEKLNKKIVEARIELRGIHNKYQESLRDISSKIDKYLETIQKNGN